MRLWRPLTLLAGTALTRAALLTEPDFSANSGQHLPTELVADTRSPNPAAARPQQQQPAARLISDDVLALIEDTMALWDAKGISVAVVRRQPGSDAFDVETRAFGVKGRDGEPMTTDTLLPIASNSKAFTVAAAGLLVANESVPLEWTTKIHRLLPEFELQDSVAQERTCLLDMFSHRTGLPRHDAAFRSYVDDPAGFSLRTVKYLRPSVEFRDVYQYNNHMFNIGASLVGDLTATRFEDFVKENVFDAIGFTRTTYNVQEAIDNGRLSEGFWRTGESPTSEGKVYAGYVDVATHVGAGGILSSANDLALWLQTLLLNGKSPKSGKQVIPSEVLAKMSTGITVSAGSGRLPEFGPVVYGMGFMQSAYQGHQYIEHGGSLHGYRSQIIRFSLDGLGIAILTNDDSHGVYVYEAIKWRIAEELLSTPVHVDWNSRNKAVNAKRLQAAVDERNARRSSPPDAPLPDVTLEKLSATYFNPAYGKLSFKVKGDGVLRAWTDNLGGGPSMLALHHFSGNHFNASITLFELPLGESENVVVEDEVVDAEFEIVDGRVKGFGVWGGLWGAGEGVPSPKGETPREKAEIWFERVEWPWEHSLVLQNM
ncbi:beta-lactamase/transpeptidase-like protein [Exidia glandulosa HHB12029]|uniref:Beta-lactamase/transpeptidase-like protein n=1 Tax=Exidia glandulosa HHB12029 TaxID=1314781 RepID=A0A165C2Z6_EXIGL|nr:beta-lactamase/transpeptidase-like protein [Exidia glandulosa HHB12029]